MYKASYANGDKWFEWIKMGAHDYRTMRINGDGSHTIFDSYALKSLAKKWVQFMNDNYATPGGQQKAATMTDGNEFVTKNTLAHWQLEHLRNEILNESISYNEIALLQSLTAHIDPADTLLLEWAGVPEGAPSKQ